MKAVFATAVMLTAIVSFGGANSAAEELDYTRVFSAEEVQSDFAALYNGLKSAHFNLFVHRDEREYDARYEKTLANITAPLTLFATQLLFQEFVAYGDVAHARIEFPEKIYRQYRDAGGRAFPIYLRIVDDRAYVGENYSGVKGFSRGDEIIAINGLPMEEWLTSTARFISADTPYIAHSLLEFSFPMYLWLELGDIEHFTIKVKLEGQRTRKFIIPAFTTDQLQASSLDAEPVFSLNAHAREARIMSNRIAYLRPGPFYNAENPASVWDNAAFKVFVDQAFESFIEQDAKALIIDLRQNPGGDNSFSDHMIAWFADQPFRFAKAFRIKSSPEAAASNQARLDNNPGAAEGVSGLFARKYAEVQPGEIFNFEIPYANPRKGQRFEGDIFVLINRHSYSNTVNVAAIIQDYGFGKILGEKTSDMATTYGAMETFRLPITNIQVGFPKAHIIRPSGEEKSDGVTPDFAIKTPIAPTKNDIVLEAALQLISEIELRHSTE